MTLSDLWPGFQVQKRRILGTKLLQNTNRKPHLTGFQVQKRRILGTKLLQNTNRKPHLAMSFHVPAVSIIIIIIFLL